MEELESHEEISACIFLHYNTKCIFIHYNMQSCHFKHHWIIVTDFGKKIQQLSGNSLSVWIID